MFVIWSTRFHRTCASDLASDQGTHHEIASSRRNRHSGDRRRRGRLLRLFPFPSSAAGDHRHCERRAGFPKPVYGTGTVEPERWAKVVPPQRRRLVELAMRGTGQAGQVLGRQDDAEERSALDQMEINRGQLERDLARAEKDRDKNDAARTEYEQRWTKLEEAKSRIAAQKAHLDSLLLRAPLDGMVLRRDGEVGEIAGPTDVLFWVGPPAPMQVVAEVNEEEINRIAAGQKAFLRSEAFPGRACAPRSPRSRPRAT